MGNPVGDHLDREALGAADRAVAGLAVTHHPGQFEGFSDPAAVFLAVQLNRQIHSFIILRQ